MIRVESLPTSLRQKLRATNVLSLDVDGVLTDGTITYAMPDGSEVKTFHAHDGQGMKDVRGVGVQVVVISGRNSPLVDRRMQELGFDESHVYQGIEEKVGALRSYLSSQQVAVADLQTCVHVGDDVNDLGLFEHVGVSVAVPNAVQSVLEASDIVLERRGGWGAVREICDLILAAKSK